MTRFKVVVTRRYFKNVEVEIEAEEQLDAEDEAMAMMDRGDLEEAFDAESLDFEEAEAFAIELDDGR